MALTAVAAFLASVPLIAHYFHLITPVSLIANLIVVPMSGAALASNLASLLFGAWCPWLTEVFNHSAWFWMKGMLWVSEWTSRWPGAALHITSPGPLRSPSITSPFVSISAGLFLKAKLRPWLIGAVRGLGVLTAIDVGKRAFATRLTVLPLGGGHAVWLDAPGFRRDALVDCGHERSGRRS
jgi:competence protein ComEC